ncbi:Gr14 [Eciton burchellii]|nr:Gr14 [Eciton burchellii]
MVHIERVIYPLSVITFFFGFGIFRHPLYNPRPLISICYTLFLWSGYVYVFYYMVNLYTLKNVISNVWHWFLMIINTLIGMISVINICDRKKFRTCIKKLNLVDDTLQTLETSKKYYKMQNSVKWILIMWFIMLCITTILDSSWVLMKHEDRRMLFIPALENYLLYINSLADIMFVLLLRYIGIKFDEINDHIKRLSETEQNGLSWTSRRPFAHYYVENAEYRKRILWIIMHLHSELCRIARDINKLFEIQIILEMMSYFVIIMSSIYFQYRTIFMEHKNNPLMLSYILFYAGTWLLVYVIRLVLLNHVCESVSTKARKTRAVTHKLTNLIRFTEMREEIHQFLLQISLRPLQFDGMGLFYFGHRFIRKFFFWIITASIFLVQMLQSSHKNSNSYRDNTTNRDNTTGN